MSVELQIPTGALPVRCFNATYAYKFEETAHEILTGLVENTAVFYAMKTTNDNAIRTQTVGISNYASPTAHFNFTVDGSGLCYIRCSKLLYPLSIRCSD
ncbi:MAG: hypothetical protein N3F63_04285 [Thermoplasmata archaeon]|nr:hypothetical protein [Thermoplasmata archaeon]